MGVVARQEGQQHAVRSFSIVLSEAIGQHPSSLVVLEEHAKVSNGDGEHAVHIVPQVKASWPDA